MDTGIHHLGLSFEKTNNSIPKEVILIKNTDKTIRWILPKDAKKAYFLKFYAVTNFRSQVMGLAFKAVFNLRLAKYLFSTKTMYIQPDFLNTQMSFNSNTWAIFTGTKGPNRKLVVSFPEQHSIFKVALNKKSTALLQNEITALDTLKKLDFKSVILAESSLLATNVLAQKDISYQGKRSSEFCSTHKNALAEIYQKTRAQQNIFDLPLYQDTVKQLKTLEKTAKANKFPQGIIRKLVQLHQSIPNQNISVAQSHGDFTPWNMYTHEDKLAIYDWELSNTLCPVGFDAFHFMLQNGVLIQRLSFKEISKKIENTITPADLNNWAGMPVDYSLYLKLFLFVHITNYAVLYAKQAHWHEQIYWQIDVWNQALNPFLTKSYSERALLIMDVFDFLHSKNYSTLKFYSYLPETLSEFSDIDLLVEKQTRSQLHHFLNNHALVKFVYSKNKSFKAELQILTNGSQFLALDVIWKLKRRWISFLDVKKILQKAYFNVSGVKLTHSLDVARFVGYFYILNQQPVPWKFQDYSGLLKNSDCSNDVILFSEFISEQPNTSKIKKMLLTKKYNKNGALLKNVFQYAIDLLKEFVFSKGIIITFSGVDGAGKSTIIEYTKQILEKKYRKKVVVIRHRPSVLPILSAWTKGKANAEKNAANTLPRQGTNKSVLSSLFRFGYYYTDYLFGQFYVYVKHTLRGDIVLYDRYYFDFINDSLRSNIQLPKWFTKGAYTFLLKPHFNFFLYADAQTILSRKKELDAQTIETLTTDYITLFKVFNNNSKSVYCAIENIKMEQTLAIIITKAVSKLF